MKEQYFERMNQKRDITKNELLKLVEVQLNKGVSKKELYEEITTLYSTSLLDENSIPKTIAYFPDYDLKLKYKQHNMVLYLLLLLTAVFKVIVAIPALFELQALGIISLVFLPFVNIWLALEVVKTRAYVYGIIGVLAIAGMFNSITYIASSGWWVLIDVIMMGVISYLGFMLSKKMFPNYQFSGPIKDENGDWIM